MNDHVNQSSNMALATERKAECVLKFAEEVGLATSRCTGFHRVGPLRVEFRDALHTNILFGRLLLESVREADPKRTSAIISRKIDAILKSAFAPHDFFERFLSAYHEAASWFVSADSELKSVRIDLLYGLFARRNGQSPTYSFPDFLIDFARYIREPENDSNAFLSIKHVPPHSVDDAYLIPDLKMPTYDERPVLTVSISADGPL